MYRILIVEDEPPITRYIQRIIETHCEGFEVVDTADNGMEALEKIQVSKPDLVLTDVKMPGMDGIALVKRIKSDHPDVFSIIISGYQDFNYVKEALKEGVIDYLLKPVDPEQLKNLLDHMVPKLEAEHNANAVRQLTRLMQHLPPDVQKVNRYLHFQYYAALIIRRGALPGRFENKSSWLEEKVYMDAACLAERLKMGKFWILDGRDASELIVVLGKNHVNAVNIQRTAESILTLLDVGPNFCTIIYSSSFFDLGRLEETIRRMYNTLDQLTVIGKSQVLSDAASSGNGAQGPPILSAALETKLTFLISSKSKNHLKNELVKLFEVWEKESRTQVWIEKMIRKIFGIVEKHTSNLSTDMSLNIEKQLEEAMFFSINLGGLLKCVWDMLEDMICVSESGSLCEKYDSIALLKKIEEHIEKKLSEPITLQGICEEFGISQPYLSRVFRKYKNMSFVEYVTDVRICEAKRLMTENKKMHLKDVAAIVGYPDPNYFSRIFKAVTGYPPSMFMN